jgi:signal transduction histidine kinase
VKESPVPVPRIPKILRSPHLWIVVAMFVVGAILHYPENMLLSPLYPHLGLSRHAMERIIFLLPMAYAGFMFGIKAGLASVGIAMAIMLPRVFLISSNLRDALLETSVIIIVGGLVNLWFEGYRREKERSQQALLRLAAAQKELQSYIQVIKNNEKRLSVLNEISHVTSQSLELQDILIAAADKVIEVMGVDNALIFLLDEDSQELVLQVYQGVSEEFASDVARLKVGEGFNGQVAQTGEPLVVENASNDPRLTREVVRREGIKVVLIVPLKPKGKVVGTLCVNTLSQRKFASEDIELLSLIANNIGVAVENAYLYQKQRIMSEQIARDAATEKQMRENLGYYLQQATRAQEEERRRIARELHDETAQDLIALSRQLDMLITNTHRSPSVDISLLEELRQQTDRTLDGVRRFSQDLRPSILDDLGLLPALEWLTSELSESFGIDIEMEVVGSVRRFTPEVELLLFRIAQEALRNVWKHSEASKAWITLEFNKNKTVLTVKDNGKGFKPPESVGDLAATGKLGLVGMQERARLVGGSLTVQSKSNKGTTISVVVPG